MDKCFIDRIENKRPFILYELLTRKARLFDAPDDIYTLSLADLPKNICSLYHSKKKKKNQKPISKLSRTSSGTLLFKHA